MAAFADPVGLEECVVEQQIQLAAGVHKIVLEAGNDSLVQEEDTIQEEHHMASLESLSQQESLEVRNAAGEVDHSSMDKVAAGISEEAVDVAGFGWAAELAVVADAEEAEIVEGTGVAGVVKLGSVQVFGPRSAKLTVECCAVCSICHQNISHQAESH